MAIDSIHRIPNFQIAESNEAGDEERRREQQRASKKKKDIAPVFKSKSESEVATSEPEGSDTITLQSQPIDTNKVIELLSHRSETTPQAYGAKIRVISKIADVKKTTLNPKKHLNKSA